MERNWVIFPPPYDFIKNLRQIHLRERHVKITGKIKSAIPHKQNYAAWLVKNGKFSVHTHAENFFASIRRLDEQAFGLSGPYLGFECNFRFLQMPYFERQAKVCDWIAQQTLVIELPLQLGSRRSQNAVEYLKSPSDLKFDSNNHSIQCAFPPDFMSNIYAM